MNLHINMLELERNPHASNRIIYVDRNADEQDPRMSLSDGEFLKLASAEIADHADKLGLSLYAWNARAWTDTNPDDYELNTFHLEFLIYRFFVNGVEFTGDRDTRIYRVAVPLDELPKLQYDLAELPHYELRKVLFPLYKA